MKKSALVLALALLGSSAFASEGYLVDGQGNRVKNGFGDCWITESGGRTSSVCDEPVTVPGSKPQVRVSVPASVAKAPQVKPWHEGFVVNFDFDKIELKPEARKALDSFITELKKNKTTEAVLIVGHTDSVGNVKYNERLGMKRAWVVQEYLKDRGTDMSRVQISSKGETQPVASNKTASGRAMNRRTEITAMGTR